MMASGPPEQITVVTSRRSTRGSSQLAEYLARAFDHASINTMALEALESQRSSATGLIVSHNSLRVPIHLRPRTIIFALQSVTNHLKGDEELRRSWQEHPPLGWIANSSTNMVDLDSLGFGGVSWTYRPDGRILSDPASCGPGTPVAWYWKDGHPPLVAHKEEIMGLVDALTDVKFWFFPDSPFGESRPNVIHVGSVPMRKLVQRTSGLVRLGDRLDIGRSTFHFLGAGRPVLYSNMPHEPIIMNKASSGLGPEISRMFAARQSLNQVKELAQVGMNYVSDSSVVGALRANIEKMVQQHRETIQ